MASKKLIYTTDTMIAGKPIGEWELMWASVPGGFRESHPELIGKCGLFRAIEDGEVAAIGKGAGEWPNRLAGRLNDYRRPGDSGRRYKMGKYINARLDTLKLEVLVTGTNSQACKTASILLRPMINFHGAYVNASPSIIQAAIDRRLADKHYSLSA